MKTIYKYPLHVRDDQIVLLPEGAEILKIHPQGEELFIWSLVDPARKNEQRRFRIFGTGQEVKTDGGELKHLDSVFMEPFVWHVYEVQSGWM